MTSQLVLKIFCNIGEEKLTETWNFNSIPIQRQFCTVIATSIINRIALTLSLDIDRKWVNLLSLVALVLGRGASGGCLSPGSLTSPTEAHLLPPGLHIQPVLVIFYVLLSYLSNTVLESLAINTISALMSDAAAWTARLYAHCRRWESVKASQVCLWRKIMHFRPLAPSLLNVMEYVWMSGTTYIVCEWFLIRLAKSGFVNRAMWMCPYSAL